MIPKLVMHASSIQIALKPILKFNRLLQAVNTMVSRVSKGTTRASVNLMICLRLSISFPTQHNLPSLTTHDRHNAVCHGWFTHNSEAGTLQIVEKLNEDSSCRITSIEYPGIGQSWPALDVTWKQINNAESCNTRCWGLSISDPSSAVMRVLTRRFSWVRTCSQVLCVQRC